MLFRRFFNQVAEWKIAELQKSIRQLQAENMLLWKERQLLVEMILEIDNEADMALMATLNDREKAHNGLFIVGNLSSDFYLLATKQASISEERIKDIVLRSRIRLSQIGAKNVFRRGGSNE